MTNVTYFSVLALAAGLALGAPATAQPNKNGKPGLSAAAQRLVTRAMRGHLINPGDAKFRWPAFSARDGRNPRPYCGFVNARNAIGRYAGFRPYLAYLTVARGRVVRAAIYGVADNNPTNPVTVAVRQGCAAAGYSVSDGGS